MSGERGTDLWVETAILCPSRSGWLEEGTRQGMSWPCAFPILRPGLLTRHRLDVPSHLCQQLIPMKMLVGNKGIDDSHILGASIAVKDLPVQPNGLLTH